MPRTAAASWIVLWCGLAVATEVAAQPPASSDSTSTLLRRLQQRDVDFFDAELLDFDLDYTDSMTTRLDSLGLHELRRSLKDESRPRSWRFDLGLAERLFDYNRAEGAVLGLSATTRGPGLRLRTQAAWATNAKKLRYWAALEPDLPGWAGEVDWVGWYEDRVRSFGSSRPSGSPVRAFFGADDRDYLRFRGGGLYGRWRGPRRSRVQLGYEAGQEWSVRNRNDFAVFESLEDSIPAIQAGMRRALVARVRLGDPGQQGQEVRLAHQFAGRGLGGDFDFQRSDIEARLQGYLGRQELLASLGFAHATGSAPIQHQPDIGGLSTVRGYPRRTRVGQTSLALQLEYLVPYDILAGSRIPWLRSLHFQFVPWFDAGRVWPAPASDWITSAGLGIQRLIGPFEEYSYIRLDLAFPVGPRRLDDFEFSLRFSPLFGDF